MNKPKRYVYLCRHGQSQWNAKGILQGQLNNDLSALGQQQAKHLGQQARKWDIQQLYHSPLSRAQQTAHICAQQLTLVAQPLANTEERHFGDWQGKAVAELNEYQSFKQHCYLDQFAQPNPLGESTITVQNRLLKAIKQVTLPKLTTISGNIMLISHGDAIDCLLSLWTRPQKLKNAQAVRLVITTNTIEWDKHFEKTI